jgi:hypothetical protein
MDIQSYNPIIQNKPADTILNVKSVLAFLQDYYLSTELPERCQTLENYTGLSLVLECAYLALDFEISRVRGDEPVLNHEDSKEPQ